MRARISCLALTCLAASLVFIACGSDEPSTEPAQDAVDPAPLTACTSIPFEPAEFEEDGELVGYDIDIMVAIASKLGRTLEWEVVPFDTILESVRDDTCDVATASIQINAEREKAVALVPYLLGANAKDPDVPDPDAPRFGIAIDKGDEELRARIEGALDEMHADGTMKAVLSQWGAEEFLVESSS